MHKTYPMPLIINTDKKINSLMFLKRVMFLRNYAVKFYCKIYLVENFLESSEDETNCKIHYILAIKNFKLIDRVDYRIWYQPQLSFCWP